MISYSGTVSGGWNIRVLCLEGIMREEVKLLYYVTVTLM